MKEAVQANREALGPRHPDTLRTQLDMVVVLVDQGQREEAVRTLQQMEPNLLGWIGQELYNTEGGAVRRQLDSSQANFQDAVLTLATTTASSEASRLAGNVMLHFQGMQGEEEAYLACLRGQAAGTRPGQPRLQDHLRVQTASLDDLRGTLPADAVLIEFRQFRPVDFHDRKFGEPRFAALLLAGFDEPVVVDVGSLSELRELAKSLGDRVVHSANEAAAALYQKLFTSFESKFAAGTSVYLAPDGILDLVPFCSRCTSCRSSQ